MKKREEKFHTLKSNYGKARPPIFDLLKGSNLFSSLYLGNTPNQVKSDEESLEEAAYIIIIPIIITII